MATSEALAVHAYVNGCPYGHPDWGGRPLAYVERWPGKPLLLTETNDNGLGCEGGLGAYLRWLEAACPAVELACLFALPGQPNTPAWWSLSPETVDDVALAFLTPIAGASADLDDYYDVSNWNGDLADELARAAAEGVEGFVVRLSLESEWHRDLAVEQLRQVAAAGLALDGYLWVYWDWSPEDSVEAALRLVERAGVTIRTLWFDCEEGQPGREVVEDWLERAVDRAERAAQAVGIYSAAWWWIPCAGNTDRFAYLPLWVANYNGRPHLEPPGFGGWTTAAGHQYDGTGLDRNVFRRLPAGPGTSTPTLLPIHHALAHLADVEATPLNAKRCPTATRRAIYARILTLREQHVGPRPTTDY